jgi:hypothetical protein
MKPISTETSTNEPRNSPAHRLKSVAVKKFQFPNIRQVPFVMTKLCSASSQIRKPLWLMAHYILLR